MVTFKKIFLLNVRIFIYLYSSTKQIAMSNPDFEDEDYGIIQQRKDIEENLLFMSIKEEDKEFNETNEIRNCNVSIDDLSDDEYEEIEKIKDIEENLLINELNEEESVILNSNESNEEIYDFEEESFEKAEERKCIEENLLSTYLFEENDQSATNQINEIELFDDFDNETFKEIENRKEGEEILLYHQIEEENFDNYIDKFDENLIKDDDEITDDIDVNELLRQIEDEQTKDFNESVEALGIENTAPNNDESIFPIPDCISCSSNDEKRSVVSITENEAQSNIPSETPFRHKSMIPVQTGRKIPLPREVFETPSFRTQGRDRFDPHLLSEMKPKQKNGSKLHSSIPVNQGRKQLSKKTKEVNRKDPKEQKESQRSNVKRSVTMKQNTVNKKVNEEESKNVVISKEQPPKTISKKQLKNLTERLAPITPSVSKQVTKEQPEATVESIKAIPQTPCCSTNSDIFNRLFVMSTCKKQIPNTEEEKVEETTAEIQPIMSAKSNHLALKKDIVKISNVVGDVDECDKSNLERIMKELKIVDSTTTEDEMQMIEKEYSQCLVDTEKGVYSAKQLETRILDSISLKKHRKFDVYVNRRLAIVRANEKPVIIEQPEEKPEPVKRPTTMHRVTFDRLIAVKPAVPESDNQNVSDITLKKETEQVKLSKASQSILQKSQRTQEIMNMPLDQRDNYLMKRRNESIQKLEESLQQQEEKELKVKPSNLGALPRFYEQVQQEIKQRQPKQNQNKKATEKDSFKPKTMSYNDFQKMKEKIYGTEPKVAGVEERIKRLRLARIERNELQEALDPRALPSELKNLKKKKNPAKKNVNTNLSANQVENQDVTVNEPADAVDSVLGI